jgi:3D (Asp-Asp-Asp) domain-containing protein
MDLYRSRVGLVPLVFFALAVPALVILSDVAAKASQQGNSKQKQEAGTAESNGPTQVESTEPAKIVREFPGLSGKEACANCETNSNKPHLDLRQSIIADIPVLFIKEQKIDEPKLAPETAPVEATADTTIEEPQHTFVATAYCIKNVTACGVMARTGIVAADPSVLPLGSIVRIDAGKYSGTYRVLDTGPGVRGKRLDIFMSCRREAINFGRRKIRLEIVRFGWGGEQAAPAGE